MPLVYLPAGSSFFAWDGAGSSSTGTPFFADATPTHVRLLLPKGPTTVSGHELPLLPTIARLATTPAAELRDLAPSLAAWTLASKLALELAARERFVPALRSVGDGYEARWAAVLSGADDASRVAAIAACMPPSAHAVPASTDAKSRDAWAPEALLRAFLDAALDALVRDGRVASSEGAPAQTRAGKTAPPPLAWERRLCTALDAPNPTFAPQGFAERTLVDDLERWSEPLLGSRDRLRTCFRLELPEQKEDAFALRILLQSPDDPSLLVDSAQIWRAKGPSFAKLGRAFRDPQESLLGALGRAARVYRPIEASLAEARPQALGLDAREAFAFLNEGAAALADAGFGVIVPSELTSAGRRRLRLRMRVGGKSAKTAGVVSGAAGLGLGELLHFDWQVAIGDDEISARELAAIARQKAPLVLHRGAWVAIDPAELREIRKRLAGGGGEISVREALRGVLAGEVETAAGHTSVVAEGWLAGVLERLRDAAKQPAEAPSSLRATLRPYQLRGLSWLATMGSLGLGACLADDMGLGKTIQLLAFLLHRREVAPRDRRPALLVAPTSVLGNWEREAARFAPDLRVVAHHGAERARASGDIPRTNQTLVLTSYGLLRRDAALLSEVEWSTVALDEAQNVKNSASASAKAARALRAEHRFALTGTPVENRLAELWSILEFANSGILGPLERFRTEYAVPIERYGNEGAAARLTRIVTPFLLRREKSDPAIVPDLPAKNEMNVVCSLTREQATLYQAVVDEEMRRIEQSEGIERRGRVLALMSYLKQICNHPAQYLGEGGPLAGRSGKLARLTEMLEEALAAGDRVLVFTQFREMGDRLETHLAARLGVEVAFLHGGTPRKARDEMVRRFQEDAHGPRVFVLSLKAGGTGLNLTAASHVFHFDRWWNPAVEDQATDRAYRIGQRRSVQVHKLLCAGTVEEKVDLMLAQKRDLARRIIGAGESWITELGDAELHELFSLSRDTVVGSDEGEEEATALRAKPPRRSDAKRARSEAVP